MSASSGFAVLQALSRLERRQPGPHQLGAIASSAGLRTSHTSKILSQAVDQNLVQRVSYGKYRLAANAPTSPTVVAQHPRVGFATQHAWMPEAFDELHRTLQGYVVALHRAYYLPAAKWLLCTLVGLAAPTVWAAEALSWQGQQHPAASAAGIAMTAELYGVRRNESVAPGVQLSLAEVKRIRNTGLARQCTSGWCSLAVCVADQGTPLGAFTVAGRCADIRRAEPQLGRLLTRLGRPADPDPARL
ncbi:hypothetical protein [Streptomyces eurythermus]|uniref:hypothetical protein n=1 Tax=Streptomyces eurythermus TaxID=42237 RepID=UPI003406D116